ncbi:hypothetical protein [uncultured Eudoraea sp.]|uniref:hypothetical protein n=1 Tax=uncultured Eudoraea sp. TaxID=1035614 RepID=UPI00262C930B|nr:hypothetical protein [uncultured Eudoraea sp.]
MPNRQDNFRVNLKLKLEDNPQIEGLGEFRRSLEKDYFSNVAIRNCLSNGVRQNLVIEMDCNLKLVEILFHLQKGTWGNVYPEDNSWSKSSPFSNAFKSLNELNAKGIDVEELSIFLKDSSIIIKNIYENSIEEQFGMILHTIAENYVYLTKRLTETPFEIYIPVFEEDLFENDTKLKNIQIGNNNKKDYYAYWGLYFDSDKDAVIYDLKNKSIIFGDLYMLNH